MKKILIIEDDPFIASIYGTKYAAAGFETKTGSDGAMGLQILKSFKPDLVHLDLMVPEVNGVEIIKHIRRQPELKSLPIVVLSNTYQNRLVKDALGAGATECVSKSACTPKAMLGIVNRLLGTSEAATVEIPVLELATTPSSLTEPIIRQGSRSIVETNMDEAFLGGIRRAFLQRAPQDLAALRDRAQTLARATNDAVRLTELFELCRAAHSFGGNAAVVGFTEISQLSSALVALLAELSDKPKHITPSSLRTIADCGDFLGILLERATDPRAKVAGPANVLVVDDEALSRRAVGQAVAKLQIGTIKVGDSAIALELLRENDFSLIVLDVNMPGLNGFDLCAELRTLPAHKTTPVVFVTSLDDPESRERAAVSGGNDLIAKPFLSLELAVKALIHILRAEPNRRVERRVRAE